MNRFSRSSIASLLIMMQTGTGYGRVYVVKPGDTLSRIIKKELGGPVYGKDGKLKLVLQWNKDIKSANLIYPSQSIRLGPDEVETAAPVASSPVPPVASEPAPVAPVAEPIAETIAESPSDPQAVHHFGMDVDLLLGKTSIDATSDSAQYASTPRSRINRGFQVRPYYLLNPQASLGLQLGILQSEFAESRDGRLSSITKNLKHLSAFYHQVLAERFHVEVGLGTEQAFFLARTDQSQFELEPIFVDFLKLTLGYDLLANESWRWNLALFGKLNGSAKGNAVDAEAGKGYGAKTSMAYRLEEDWYLNAGVQFERRVQDSNQAKQRNNDILGNLGLTFLF